MQKGVILRKCANTFVPHCSCLALGTSSSSVPLIVEVISSLIFEGRRLPVISIALVLPSLIGSLFEAAQSTISAIEEF